MLIHVSYCSSPDSWWMAIDDGAAPGWARTSHDDDEAAYDGMTWDAPSEHDHDHARDAHAADHY